MRPCWKFLAKEDNRSSDYYSEKDTTLRACTISLTLNVYASEPCYFDGTELRRKQNA
jgi:hypothetical protein